MGPERNKIGEDEMRSQEEIKKIVEESGIATANEWKDRLYINVRGDGGNYRGEKTYKLWIDDDGGMHEQDGKGTTSREFDANLAKIKEMIG